MARFTALYDACVLYPAPLRDLLMHLAMTGYEGLIDGLQLPDPGDRHVLAAAIHAGADIIVTYNLADFPNNVLHPLGIEAQHPDVFLTRLLDLDPPTVCAAARRQRRSLKNPPRTVEQFLDGLARQQLSQTVAKLHEFAALL